MADARGLKDPKPSCVMTEFMKDSEGILIGLYCFTTFDDYWNVLYDLNVLIQKKRIEMHIESPATNIKTQ